METKAITNEESLQIIQQMISTAKEEQKDDGKGWIVWGWLLLAASLFSFVNLKMDIVNPYFFWNVLGLATLVLTRFVFFRKTQKVKTYTGDLFQKLNIGFFISLIFIVIAINVQSVSAVAGFALLINLYGFWALIYGTALNFRPSVIAAFVVWALGIAALYAKTFDITMLIHAGAALAGFIIPGHMARNQFKKTGPDKNPIRL
ncbi:MAG: hypothetical protein QM726_24450 [Chitinophagaceae bacterium]